MEDGGDWEGHEQDAAGCCSATTCRAGWHHVAIAHGGHGDDCPPVAGGTLEKSRRAPSSRSARCTRRKGPWPRRGRAAAAQTRARSRTHGQASGAASGVVAPGASRGKCRCAAPQQPQHQPTHASSSLLPPTAGRAARPPRAAIRRRAGWPGSPDDVGGVRRKGALALGLQRAQQRELEGEPGHAHRLQHEQAVTLRGALTLQGEGTRVGGHGGLSFLGCPFSR